MSWVMVGTAAVAVGKGVAAGISRRKARKKQQKAEDALNAENAVDTKEMIKGFEARQGAEQNLKNEYEGQTTFSPEAQYARNLSERGTASAIDKAMRSGTSSGQIMNMVSALTSRGQKQGESLSVQEAARRRQLAVMAKVQGIKTAQTGIDAKSAKRALKDKNWAKVQDKQANIAAAYGEVAKANDQMINDIGGAAMTKFAK